MFNTINNDIQAKQITINDNQLNIDTNNPIDLDSDKFNQEVQRVKEILSQELSFTYSDKVDDRDKGNIKHQALVSENNYLKNSNNAIALIKDINLIHSVNANINQTSSSDSLHDFFNEVKSSIVIGKHDYLDVLKNIFSNYMNYINDIRESLSSLAEYTKPGKKEGYISVDFSDFNLAIEAVMDRYAETSPLLTRLDIVFVPQNDGSFIRELNGKKIRYENKAAVDKAVAAINELISNIKGTQIQIQEDSPSPDSVAKHFLVNINFDDIAQFNFELSLREPGDMLQTEFELFKKTLDVLEKRMNTYLDELSKKYSAANTNFDNFVKVVSSTMNTLLEMAKGFLRY